MQIRLTTLTGQHASIDVEPDTTIAWAKIQLYDIYGIDPGVCKITKESKTLKDHETFEQNNICSGDVLGLMTLFGTFNHRLPLRGISDDPLNEDILKECYNTCFG